MDRHEAAESAQADAGKGQGARISTATKVLIVGGGSSHDFDRWFNQEDTKTLSANGQATVSYTDKEPNGLATMLGGLIEANLRDHPNRERLLKPAVIALTAPDAGVSVTLRMAPGRVEVSKVACPLTMTTSEATVFPSIMKSTVPLGWPAAPGRPR